MEKDKENTLSSLIKLQQKFKYNYDQLISLRKDAVFLYKIIISILNNIQNNFLIKKITNDEYNKYLSGINKIYEKYNELVKKITVSNIIEEGFFNIKLQSLVTTTLP